jgi:O-antigen/teichoic acid export membrane protein
LNVIAASLAAILIARRLDPPDWGIFSAFLGLGFALAIFVELGLATWLLRELSRLFADDDAHAQHDARELAGAAAAVAAAMTSAVLVVGTGVSALLGTRAELVLVLAALLLYGGLFASANVLETHLRAQRRLRRVIAASLAEKYLLVVLVVTVGVTSSAVWPIAVSYVAAGAIRVAVVGLSVFGRSVPPRPSIGAMRSIVRRSAPFALSSGALTVVPRLDALVILAFSATAAGYFALGDRLLGPAFVVASISATTLYPFLARRTHRPAAIWNLSGGFAVCGLVVGGAGILVAPTLVPALFGAQYEEAVDIVRIMLLSMPLVYAANPLLAYGFSSGSEREIVRATVAVSLAGTASIVVGQALVGVTGAAAGFLLRQALVVAALGSIAVVASRREGRPAPMAVPTIPEGRIG